MKGFFKGVVIFAVIAGLIYGVYYAYDVASGAKAAREAIVKLQRTAEEWKNNEAKTIYD